MVGRRLLTALLVSSLLVPVQAFSTPVKDAQGVTSGANAPAKAIRTLQATDLFNLESAENPQVSPDGKRIAYVRRSADIMQDRYHSDIWLFDLANGKHRPLLSGNAGYSSPSWSPDGSRLLYNVGGEDGGLYVMNMDDRSSYRLLASSEGGYSPVWSRDGKSIAFLRFVPGEEKHLATPPSPPVGAQWAPPVRLYDKLTVHVDGIGFVQSGNSQIFTVPADGGTPRQITHEDYGFSGLNWLDGETLLATGNSRADADMDPRESDILAVNIATGAVRPLTDRHGPDEMPAASPDGRLIAYVGYDDRVVSWQRNDLYVMEHDGGNPRNLTASLDRSVSSPVWAADGRHIFVMAENEGRTEVMQVGLDGQRKVLADDLGDLGGRPYAGGSYSVSGGKGGIVIAYTQASTNRPPELAMLRIGGAPRRLTDLNSDVLDGVALPEVRKLSVNNPKDHLAIDAWMAIPPQARPAQGYPLILEIHGGPATMYGSLFSTEIQRYAAEGFLTLWTNQRGSLGYGEKFALSIDRKFPGVDDLGDLMAAVDAVIATGLVDPQRLYVTGGSAGGTMTAWAVAHTNRFAAAAAVNPVVNWTSVMLAGDTASHVARHQIRATPWENPDLFWSLSPLSKVGDVNTPTMLMVGDDDWRAPPFEAEQFYTALKLRGVDTVLARIPESGHAIGARPSQQISKTDTIIAWFKQHSRQVEPTSAVTASNH